jgi:hypothetical protein
MPELCRVLHRIKSRQSLVKVPSSYKIIRFYFGTIMESLSLLYLFIIILLFKVERDLS